MKSNIKGLKVSVNVAIKADEIATCNFRHDKDHERKNDEAYKGLDVSVSAGIEMEESDGEVDLREISDLLHHSIKEQVEDRVKECLDERCSSKPDCTKDGLQHYKSDFEAFKKFNSLMYGE